MGGRGGNKLKERFQAAAAFQGIYKQAYAEMYQALYGSGAALAELDRLAGIIGTSGLITPATLESEIAAMRSAIDTQAAVRPAAP